MKNYLREKLTPINVFLGTSLFGILVFFVLLAVKGPILMEWIMIGNNSDWALMDYFRHVSFGQNLKEVYLYSSACFPPFAYLIYHLLFRFTSYAPFEGDNWWLMLLEPWQLIIFLMYIVLGIFIIICAIDELPLSKTQKRLLYIAIFFSVPMFAGALERGNMVLYVTGLVLLAYAWKDSASRVKREFAMLFIAIAAGLKIYPAVMGVLYLREKRYKEAMRLIVYGIAFYVIPLLFMDGLNSVRQLLGILRGMMFYSYEGRIEFFSGLLSLLGIQGMPATVINILFVLSLLCGIFFSKSKFRKMFFVASFMTLIAGEAYRYTLNYFLLTLVVLIEEKETKCWDYINSIFLGTIFSIPVLFGIVTGFRLNMGNYGIYTRTYLDNFVYLVVWIFVGVQFALEIKDIILCIKSKNKNAVSV